MQPTHQPGGKFAHANLPPGWWAADAWRSAAGEPHASLLVPSVLIAFVGSRLCRRIKSPIRRMAVRRLILSFAFTPSVYPHGPALARWILILGSWSERTYLGALPIVVVWTIGVLFGVLRGNKDIPRVNASVRPTG